VLILIGNDKTRTAQELVALAHKVGVANRVRFIGWMNLDDAEARLAHSDLAIALLETNSEQLRTALGASNKRYQYMKAGLPQIGDHNRGVPELIEDNGIGLCVSEHSVDAISAAVCRYVTDPARRAADGTRAYELHQSTFHYERVFRRLLDAVQG
jgi:glycosyltransferase involved in cell wall biosynthesis